MTDLPGLFNSTSDHSIGRISDTRTMTDIETLTFAPFITLTSIYSLEHSTQGYNYYQHRSIPPKPIKANVVILHFKTELQKMVCMCFPAKETLHVSWKCGL
jgi:hypothetical protein